MVEFFLHRIGNLIETAAALLVDSVGKIASGHEADVRMCYSQALQKSFSKCLYNFFLISLCFACLGILFLHFPRLCLRSAASPLCKILMHLGIMNFLSSIEIHLLKVTKIALFKNERANGAKIRERFPVSKVEFHL